MFKASNLNKENYEENNNFFECLESFEYKKLYKKTCIDSEKNYCCICLDNITKKKNIILNCNHSFHSLCFKNYINSINNNIFNCPLCRKEIDIEDISIFKNKFNIREFYEYVFDKKLEKCDAICDNSLNLNKKCKNRLFPLCDNYCLKHSNIKFKLNDYNHLYKSLIFILFYIIKNNININFNNIFKIFKLTSNIFLKNQNIKIFDVKLQLEKKLNELSESTYDELLKNFGIITKLKIKILN